MTTRFDLMSAPLDRGTVVLEASAGTGKTYALVGLLLRLLLERRIDRLDEALVVTFTVAAAEELKNRVRAALLRALRAAEHGADDDDFFAAMGRVEQAAPILRAALDDFDRVPIATIHGFCKRLLDEGAFETREPFVLDFVADPLPYLHNAAADALRTWYTPRASVAGALLHLARLEPKQLVKHYSLWRRFPDVRLSPARPDPEACFGAVQAAVERAAAALDDEACEVIERVNWLAGKSLAPVASRYSTARLCDRVAAEPLLALPEFFALSRTRLDRNQKKSGRPPVNHAFFAACEEVHDAVLTAQEHLRAWLLHEMDRRLTADKRRDHVLDFQDLLARTHAALRDPDRRQALLAAINARHRVALIDEFQDTDRLQYDIFATCFRERPLFLIGDPKQSIYGFRGADLRAYVEAREDASARFTLGTNWRSSRELVDAVQRACGRPGAFVDAAIECPDVRARAAPGELAIAGDDGPPLQWRFVDVDGHDARSGFLFKHETEDRIAADVTAEISRLLRSDARCDGRPLVPRDIAVLCRTNAQATLVQDHLRRAGMVSAIGKAGDVFATDEVVELDRLMRATLQPRNVQACRAAMSTRIYGLSAGALAALEDDDEGFDRELANFDRWRRTWMQRGFFAMKEQLLADRGVEGRMLAARGGERRLTNLQQLCELLHRAEHDNRLSPEGLHDWLEHERLHHEEIDYELRELRLESDDDAVQILTVHGSKGLEYEVVFCPYLWDAREARNDVVVPRGAEHELVFAMYNDHEHKPAAERERLAEDVRLAYVALTRARRRCYVHFGPIGAAHASALAWLLAPVPPDKQHDRAERRDGEWVLEWCRRMRSRPAQFAALVDELVAGSAGTMARVDVPADPRPEPVPPARSPGRGAARRPQRVPRARGLFSFSSLVADAGHEPPARDVADPAAAVDAARSPAGIFAFARGPAAGNCLHAILERVDWRTLAAPAADDDGVSDHRPPVDLVAATLAEFGLADPARHDGAIDPVAVVVDNLRELARAEVRAGGPTFAELGSGTNAVEWQFTLPADEGGLAALGELFRASGSEVARRYSDRMAELPPRVVHGFLTGYVDLVAEHDGRYWIVDWKSNHLGAGVERYDSAALARAMHEHDYVLQYHLYVLALHRQLRRRLPDYDYDRDFGGVGYAFLRGVVAGSDAGVFGDRPPRKLVEAMDRWVAGDAP